jgi:penicillin G amidase
MRHTPARALSLVLAALTLLACSAGSYVWYRVAPDYPAYEDAARPLPGLEAPAHVRFDQAGVPHIQAESELDLMRAVGFAQARDRFFAMDMMRRFARGRLSELVGDRPMVLGSTVRIDVSMRGWGFDRAADAATDKLDVETRALLEAYTAGVNAGVAAFEPVEYRLLGVTPEPWRVADTFALGLLNAWSVTHNWHQESTRLVLALSVGWERAAAIYDNEPWAGGESLPPGAEAHELKPAVAPELKDLFPARPYAPLDERAETSAGLSRVATWTAGASNAWVVGGARSASGKPLLANDPHLTHLLPSILYQQHLTCPGLDVIGVTMAGLPYVLAGHNERVAWGMTSTVGDAIDLYVELTDPDDPDLVLGADGEWHALVRDEVVIRVRDGGDYDERRAIIRRSPRGPLLNDLYPDLLPAGAPPVSIRWDRDGAERAIPGLRAANKADSVGALKQALGALITPVQTWTAADVDGQVALFASGRVPIRAAHRGTFPAPGWKPEYEWQGWVSPEAMPAGVGSGDQVYAHGNNLMIDPRTVTHPTNVDSAPSYRADRILERIAEQPRHTAESFAAIQTDVVLVRARRLAPAMIEVLEAVEGWSPIERQALDLLAAWDHEARVDAGAAAVFFQLYREAELLALADELSPRGLKFLLSQRYSTNVADGWFLSEDHVVWDHRGTEAREARSDILPMAFRLAVAALITAQGDTPAAWRWGALHDMELKHAFGGKLSAFNLPQVEVPGGQESVWKSYFDMGHPETPFRAIAGPSMRMVVDLADIHHARWVIETGASGWPRSPHYGDQHPLWLKGELLPMVSLPEEVEAAAQATLTLTPPADE